MRRQLTVQPCTVDFKIHLCPCIDCSAGERAEDGRTVRDSSSVHPHGSGRTDDHKMRDIKCAFFKSLKLLQGTLISLDSGCG